MFKSVLANLRTGANHNSSHEMDTLRVGQKSMSVSYGIVQSSCARFHLGLLNNTHSSS